MHIPRIKRISAYNNKHILVVFLQYLCLSTIKLNLVTIKLLLKVVKLILVTIKLNLATIKGY